MVRVSIAGQPLTATAALVRNGDLLLASAPD
jgi:hypothetical protein